jgi:peptide methionine sulfoxide reductase MsrA
VVYDPEIISYRKLVELFWTQINPTDEGGQFNDR